MVTAGTYLKDHYFRNEERLQLLHDMLLNLATTSGWELHAWAVFSNHYHFVARSPSDPSSLSGWLAKLHQNTASYVNRLVNATGRQVWFQYWDSRITIHTSYLARLNYVHRNAVKHGLVTDASHYRWCSASRFQAAAAKSFVKSVYSFDYSKVKVFDEF